MAAYFGPVALAVVPAVRAPARIAGPLPLLVAQWIHKVLPQPLLTDLAVVGLVVTVVFLLPVLLLRPLLWPVGA